MFRSQITPCQYHRLALLTLVVVGLITYVSCLSSDFVFDDVLYIDASTLNLRSLNWLAPDTDLPIKGRPLVGLTFVANYAFGKASPEGYHAFNMAVHLLCAVALFGVVRRTMLRFRPCEGREVQTTGLAFTVAAIWMVHPLQTECVNYVSQRSESMAALFILASLYGAIRAHESLHRGRWIAFVVMTSWAAALCKEIAAIGPLLILLYDWTFANASLRDLVRDRWRVYLATFSCWIPAASLLYLLPRSETIGANADVTVLQYALNQGVLIIQYLRLVFWPDVLVIDYGRPREIAWFEALPPVAAVCGLLSLTLATCRRFPVVGFLGLSAFLLLAPTSSIVPINSEVGAERRMYLPLAAIVTLVVLGARECIRRCCVRFERRDAKQRSTAGIVLPMPFLISSALVLLTITALGIRSVNRNRDYAHPTTLWQQAIDAYPNNPRAWSWLAMESSRIDPVIAKRVTATMAQRWQDDWSVQFDAAEAFLSLHRDPDTASRHFRRVVELDPTHAKARVRLVWLLAGCVENELRDGQEALRIATELQNEYPTTPEVLDALAIAQAECGAFDEAIATAEAAIANAQSGSVSTNTMQQRIKGYRRHEPFRFDKG